MTASGRLRGGISRIAATLVFGFLMCATLLACGPADGSGAGTSDDSAQPAGGADLAPELVALEDWHNTEPLTLASLKGQTVLLVFFSDT